MSGACISACGTGSSSPAGCGKSSSAGPARLADAGATAVPRLLGAAALVSIANGLVIFHGCSACRVNSYRRKGPAFGVRGGAAGASRCGAAVTESGDVGALPPSSPIAKRPPKFAWTHGCGARHATVSARDDRARCDTAGSPWPAPHDVDFGHIELHAKVQRGRGRDVYCVGPVPHCAWSALTAASRTPERAHA